jgi:predicted transcriptional regulator
MSYAPAELQDVATRVHAGETVTLTVRNLLWLFNAQRRGTTVVWYIRMALREVHLATFPDFEQTYIDARVELRPVPLEPALEGLTTVTPQPEVSEETETITRVLVGGSVADPVPRVSMLAAANSPPVIVNRDAELSQAVTLMLMHDFSQLPVMQNERTVDGIISWKSIGAARARNRETNYVRDCMENVEILGHDTPLFEAIEVIARREVVLVRDAERKISGLITTTDISLQFRNMAEPFLLLGEIENHVRRLIGGKFTLAELLAVRNPADEAREVRDVSDLTFGEYIRLLETPEHWEKLRFNLSRPQFVDRMDEIRRIRNEVMHFHPDALSPADLRVLRDTVRFMQTL